MRVGWNGLDVVVYVVLHEVLGFLLFSVCSWVYCCLCGAGNALLPLTLQLSTVRPLECSFTLEEVIDKLTLIGSAIIECQLAPTVFHISLPLAFVDTFPNNTQHPLTFHHIINKVTLIKLTKLVLNPLQPAMTLFRTSLVLTNIPSLSRMMFNSLAVGVIVHPFSYVGAAIGMN